MRNLTKTKCCGWPGVLTLAIFCLFTSFGEARAITCEITPDQVPIDLSYHGANLVVHGHNAPGHELIVKISSEAEDLSLKYQGKAGGLFWMKMGDIEFKNVPDVYLLYTTREIERLLAPEARNQYSIGYPALKEQSTVESAGMNPDKERWFGEFLKFKQRDNLYKVQEGVITRKHGQEGDEYRLEVAWPYQAPPGTYKVAVLAVQNGEIVDSAETSLRVDRAGMVARLSHLAFNQAAIYGIMAIVIALIAGFAVGAMFKKGGGAH